MGFLMMTPEPFRPAHQETEFPDDQTVLSTEYMA
ncbi:hypothetical protein PB2503_00732 [Parvularcula bermudensis HTCC2503]|uniref:Uncharacterized protein n=1 Tax=Parvularcula bermudensis (strain ATCC BAA-594 / HTCC2503 / KCTC 12087) TaxID=314260 RepID=E0TB18_PARBH|nr:hypothetical protein PB2503_00732 [Parvularcula bermudensis HTCC2503]